ncbi:hypothetical protein PVAP13_4KG218806 [Panicum virgatum]|uniref:Uncharacterized protein n=1 Tax=Panicum virgatum TaxID=38727 RepID=A0A8T0TS95_PANVG|nr:hypothetical protein PVAP13_4KG218806 [Panicum virgatum]
MIPIKERMQPSTRFKPGLAPLPSEFVLARGESIATSASKVLQLDVRVASARLPAAPSFSCETVGVYSKILKRMSRKVHKASVLFVC